MWVKLKSRKYCEKILLLFGRKDICELKLCIEKEENYRDKGYHYCAETIPMILDSVDLGAIASMN